MDAVGHEAHVDHGLSNTEPVAWQTVVPSLTVAAMW